MRNKPSNINSNDGRFHDGNPATGSLGTVVTAAWLNEQQDFAQSIFEELKNVLALGGLQPIPAKYNQVAEAIEIAIRNVKNVVDSNTRTLQNVIPNSKKSDAVNSNSSDTVATSKAVKTAHDKALEAKSAADEVDRKLNVFKIPVKGSSAAVNIDLSSRQSIIDEIGTLYKGSGIYELTFHNSLNHHQLSHFPLDVRGPVVLEVGLMGGFSYLKCHYLIQNRQFFTRINWNEATLVPSWQEQVSTDKNGRTILRHTSPEVGATLRFEDYGAGFADEITKSRAVGSIETWLSGEMLSAIRTYFLTDKNSLIEFAGKNAAKSWTRFAAMFSKTGNVAIGRGGDNGHDRLQVNGTACASTPPLASNNDQLATTEWVRQMALLTAQFNVRTLSDENLNDITTPGLYGQPLNAKVIDGRNYPLLNTAGALEVLPSAYGVLQRYTTFHTAECYVRVRQPHNGQTLWGTWQRVDGKARQYAEAIANNGEFAGLNVARTGSSGSWLARVEALPDKRWKFWTENAGAVFLPAMSGNQESTVLLQRDFSGHFAQNGWCRLPNGLLLQWGDGDSGHNGGRKLSFPTAFREVFVVVDSALSGGEANFDRDLHWTKTQVWTIHAYRLRYFAVGI